MDGCPPAALVFDLDGTLVDSRRDLATAVNRVRASYGLAPLSLARVLSFVGEGARTLVARALGLDPGAQEGAEGARLDEAMGRFFIRYGEVKFDTTRAYPGVPELLAALAERHPLAVLTNKPERFSREILEHLGLSRFFRHLIGGDTLPTRKPDPAGLADLAARFGVPVAEVMLVGDSRVDAATAANAGCRFALVTWGFAEPAELAQIRARCEPALIAATAGDLERALLAFGAQPAQSG
jgi:phosphoglycolate phosphatase